MKEDKPKRKAHIGQFKFIKLNKDQYAIVDAEDSKELNKYNWFLRLPTGSNTQYAQRNNWCKKSKKHLTPLKMHRVIMNAQKDEIVDHINGNGLDNRKSNLRICTTRQNNRNQRPQIGRSSKYKGVYWKKDRSKWRANIKTYGKSKHLGYFIEEVEAAKAYNKAALELFGEYSLLNEVTDA